MCGLLLVLAGLSTVQIAFAIDKKVGEEKESVVKGGYTLTKADMEGIRVAAIQYLQRGKLEPVMQEKRDLFIDELKEGNIIVSDPSDTSDFNFPRIGRWIFQIRENQPTLGRKAAPEDYGQNSKIFFLFGLNLQKIEGKWQVNNDFNIKMGKRH